MKVLVTGAKGQLGSELKYLSGGHAYDFVFIDQEELDLTKLHDIIPYLLKVDPDFIINCAAYTAVDKAEDEPDLAQMINADAPKEIARYCKENGKRLIHVSTDYVFNGDFSHPIDETATPDPQSVYGSTKLEGEKAISDELDNAYIIRTAWVYSSFGNNFVKTMLRLGSEKEELDVVSDQIGSPTYARDLAGAILQLIEAIENGSDHPDIYHYSNEGICSWYEFASEIMKIANVNCKINPIKSSDFPTKAKRPAYSVLDKNNITKKMGVEVPYWKLSLKNCLPLILNKNE